MVTMVNNIRCSPKKQKAEKLTCGSYRTAHIKSWSKRSHTVLSTVWATALAVDQMFTFNNVTDAETVPDDGPEAEEPQRWVATVAAYSAT